MSLPPRAVHDNIWNLYFQTIVLWSCRHVTEQGLTMLVEKCPKLESINYQCLGYVGMRVPVDCFVNLLAINLEDKTCYPVTWCWKGLASGISNLI